MLHVVHSTRSSVQCRARYAVSLATKKEQLQPDLAATIPYVDSKMDDFNSFEKVNVASDPMYTVKKAELRAVLTAAFNPPPPPAQTSSKPALIGGIVGALCFLAVLACFLACRKHGRLRWKK